MKLAIASDHGGFRLKESLKEGLLKLGHDYMDLGTDGEASVDYPEYAARVARAVLGGEADRGILVCGTGIGISIAANRFPGIRAALVHDPETARLCAEHNRANVLALGGRLLAPEYALELVRIWLETPFEERHQRRLDLITEIERQLREESE